MYRICFKRALDVVLSFFGIVFLLLPMLLIAVAIAVSDPGPVIFKQKRVGKGKKLFTLYKFRSMKVNVPDVPTHLLEDPYRYITRVGAFLRRTSLDELPQLFNILFGQMSFVGPRPALWNQEDLIAQRDLYKANDVYPGLTGWAQVNGRDELSILEKARLDGVYTKVLLGGSFKGFLMDCKCFFATFCRVLSAKGVVEGRIDK